MRHPTPVCKVRNRFALLMLLTVLVACQGPKALYTLDESAKAADRGDAPLVSTTRARIDPEVLVLLVPGKSAEIGFPVPDKEKPVPLDLKPVSAKALALPEGQHAWVAQLPGGHQAFFMRIGDSIEARVPLGDTIYRLRSRPSKIGILEVFDAGQFQEHPTVDVPPDDTPTDDTPTDDVPPVDTPTDGGTIEPDVTEEVEGPSSDSSCNDPADRVDIMVVYTKAAAEAGAEALAVTVIEAAEGVTPAAEGVTPIESRIAFAIGLTNLAYFNSKVTHRLNLVYAGVTPPLFSEPLEGFDSGILVGELADGDGELGKIHDLRSSKRADLVSLIFEKEDGGGCGLPTSLNQKANAETKEKAFTVVQRECADIYMSLAHETGHNMGARHDFANAGSNPELGYNYGHIHPFPSDAGVDPWRTVMSYAEPCGCIASTAADAGSDPEPPEMCKEACPADGECGEGLRCNQGGKCVGTVRCSRVSRFSNPDGTFGGDPTGDPTTEHNVKALELNAEGVSRYLCLQRGKDPNVWMKDLWQDEGREPDDPATEGEPMWKSPYIWVRRTEDEILGKEYAHLEHEHEHEDPQQGQTNYVYVKLHNTGGTKESAKLELYFAGPSTNLDDPASWTLIGSEPRTIEPGVDVAKFEWSNIPGSGHYCLLARWNIEGGPLAFTSLGDAVRADNDLIWRNVNVIELGGSPQTESVFAMAGDEQSDETYLLITTKPISRRKLDWEQLVGASIEVDPARLNRGELRVEGLRQRSRREFEFALGKDVKLIGPFMLRRRETTRVKLTTIADPGAVKKRGEQLANPAHYDITVMQIRPAGVKFFENPSKLFEEGWVIGGVSYTLRVPAGK